MSAHHLGIDLGTSNSVAVVHDGTVATVVRTAQGAGLTPSVVRIDARGQTLVGARARRHLDTDPAHTKSEWKRLLGSQATVRFGASGPERTPRELSSLVLASLRRDVEEQLGFAPRACVITVPALFEIPQSRDTAAAAEAAGFERVELLQEPVASALAAGQHDDGDERPWLVYDLGGGTFDVSLVETRDGILRVIGHDGDNFLGGRDFDSAIVAHVLGQLDLPPAVAAHLGSPDGASARARLRAAVEEAKIELSRARATVVSVPGLRAAPDFELDVDVDLSQDDFARLTVPLVDRSIDVCVRLLRRHGIAEDGLARVVLVGGPTVIPHLRARVRERLSAPLGEGLDPMTLVAEGAALHARALGLDARGPAPNPSVSATSTTSASSAVSLGPRVWLQFPSVSADTSPFVVGRMLDAKDGVREVRAVRLDGGFPWAVETPDAEGTFALSVELLRRTASSFRIEGRREGGSFSPLTPPEFAIQHGTTLGDPPLARSIGVCLADDTVRVYFERGSPLPIRRSFRHKTAASIEAGRSGDALVIPIVQGESVLARFCRRVGEVRLDGAKLPRAVPVGSDVDVTIELDRAGSLRASAAIVALGVAFDGVATLVTEAVPLEALEGMVAQLGNRVAELRRRAFSSGRADVVRMLADADASLRDVDATLRLAQAGDADALERCRRLVVELDERLSDREESFTRPELVDEIEELLFQTGSYAAQYATDAEHDLLTTYGDQFVRLKASGRVVDLERIRVRLRDLRQLLYRRWPGSWENDLEYCAGLVGSSTDPRRADALVRDGRAALARGDQQALKTAVRALWALLPPSAREASSTLGSGIR